MKPIDSLSDDEWLALVQRALAMPEAPDRLVQDALALWHAHRPLQSPHLVLKRWVAVLSFDSLAGAAVAAGMRALPSEVRQLLFCAELGDIELRIAPVADAFALSGQLLGLGAHGSVELTELGRGSDRPVRRSIEVDGLGEFRIDRISSGTCLISVRQGSDEIVLPPIDVGLPRDAGGGP